MKKLLALLLLAVGLSYADTLTTRVGLTAPTIGSSTWGSKLNTNFTIIDSSMCTLTGTNNITGTINFAGALGPIFQNSNNDGTATIYNNGQIGKSELNLYGVDGVGVNTTNQMNTLRGLVDLAVKQGTTVDGTTNQGRFAIIGSSADASMAYSGFRATGPITSSTLWSLPVADGASGQLLTTDGSAHLSFTYLGSLQKNLQLNGSSGSPGTISSMTITAASAPGMGISIQPAFLTSGVAAVIYSSAGINFVTPGSSVQFLQNMNATRGLIVGTMTATGFDISTTSTSVTGSGGFFVSTATINHIVGTLTNDNATTGTYGEYISSASTANSYPTSGNYGDGASFTLTAGDWDITALLYTDANGATMTLTQLGISTTSGNSATGLTLGDNSDRLNGNLSESGIVIPAYRQSISGSTTFYCKVRATYTVATPKYTVRLTARRVR